MPERACMRIQVSKATAAEKLKNASTVDSKTMRDAAVVGIKALGQQQDIVGAWQGGTSSTTVGEKRSSGTPSAIAPKPTRPTSSG